MRVVFSVVLILSIAIGAETSWAGSCADLDKAMEVAPQPVAQENYSVFRGISLASRPEHVRWHAQSLGFDTLTVHFVGDYDVAAIVICANHKEEGRADFDRAGRMLRLSLMQRFFSESPIFVRKFADDLFEFYEVETRKVDDDVCFQDVTCFQGISRFGERFLILRIGADVELYVRP